MNLYWLLVTVGCLALFITLFIIGETIAFKQNKLTLSRWVYNIQKAWPPFGFFLGFFCGALIFGLAVHFFWQWCPDIGAGVG